jgi:hypothetical protein
VRRGTDISGPLSVLQFLKISVVDFKTIGLKPRAYFEQSGLVACLFPLNPSRRKHGLTI